MTAEELLSALLPILKRGNDAEIKRVGGDILVIEIERKVKYRTTLTTG